MSKTLVRRWSSLGFVLISVSAALGAAEAQRQEAGQSSQIGVPLVAHWTFDETSGGRCDDASGNGWAANAAPHSAALSRRRGVLGNALLLAGHHRLQIESRIPLEQAAGISLCAWIKPTELRDYREVFRK